jgi:hypothetical protein
MNKRATIIFGNGIGMSLNPQYFNLESGLKLVWDTTDLFTENHKKLIQSVLPNITDKIYPQSEESLGDLQKAIFASETLQAYETPEAEWLNKNSRELAVAFKKYIHDVGIYFQKSGEKLPEIFTDHLSEFIKKTKTHVGVLNYDNLIYEALIGSKVLDGFNGTLIDGFVGGKFSSKNLRRHDYKEKRLGWFLNLHGSPLFIDDRKVSSSFIHFLEPNYKSHIVLTHVNQKRVLISASPILNEYWIRLNQAIKESSHIILFGYSGEDIHLNDIISNYSLEKKITIIEWSGSGSYIQRFHDWSDKLDWSTNIKLIQLDNILEFTDWDLLK